VVELLPSILSADFARLADAVEAAERGGGTVIHVDVMDGHFVPNITLGPPVVKSLRRVTELPLDCHLMIENPDDFIPAFAEAGANWVGVHYEACVHLHRTIEHIRDHGMEPGVVLNPATRVDLLYDVLPMLHHVLIMSVNPGFGAEVHSLLAGQDPAPARTASGAEPELPYRSRWGRSSRHGGRRRRSRSGAAGCWQRRFRRRPSRAQHTGIIGGGSLGRTCRSPIE
jgi:hypothetical protein